MDDGFSPKAIVTPLYQPDGLPRPVTGNGPVPIGTGSKRWLTRKEAADYMGVHPRTLANWAATGHGPRYSKPSGNSCMYRLDDLDAYLQARMVHTNDQPEAA
ncbi:helix-turn-helix transcriptional regulator [Nocardia salmonicida]|uniref:helix-turn-helix transcriptional regulator n=1 Tax=Nocardia salmonicida TaxID=53431 RepID=UPI0036CB86FF